jgi:hypothetical protein
MQYVLLIYQGTTPLPTDPDSWATLSEAEQRAIYQDYRALNKTSGVSPGSRSAYLRTQPRCGSRTGGP